MTQSSSKLYQQMDQGPAVLLLGQKYLQIESGEDSFLSELLRKYSQNPPEHADYFQLFNTNAHNSVESALAWLQDRGERLSVPKWLTKVADYPWSAVYTSAIDTIWPRAFRNEWRTLQPLFEEKFNPTDPRNRSNLHCTFLFGSVGRIETTERPPLNRFELSSRRQVAIALARRLPEVLTPFGVLLVEGYAGDRDWLQPEDLFPILDQLTHNQVHLFSVTEDIERHSYIDELVRRGKIILHSESLASCLSRGETSGFIRLGVSPEDEEHGHRVTISEKAITVPISIWNQISKSAIVLDDTVLLPPPPLSEERRYVEFRNFLSDSSIRPMWDSYNREFAFHRVFEKELLRKVDDALSTGGTYKYPLILHGQTGTGKTVALGSLALSVRKRKQAPVLFIERKSQRPIGSDIDQFCKWSEDQGAQSVLIVWDGMVDLEIYNDLLQYLFSRGRKVVMVGSSYYQEKKSKAPNYVEAPSTLTPKELNDFRSYLSRFDPALNQVVRINENDRDSTFLVALYRLLPPTRSLIRSGVAREVGYAEEAIKQKVEHGVLKSDVSTLSFALLKANIISEKDLLRLDEPVEIAGENVTRLEKLIGLVMVPGRFGLRVPIELLLRALNRETIENFAELFKGVDVFRWYEDVMGNIFVGPRHALEAQLVSQSRLGGPHAEVEYAKHLLLEVRDRYEFSDDPDLQFAVELVRCLGPNSPVATYFAPYFREVSEALTQLRIERGVRHPRLMLQEASLLREYVVKNSKAGNPPSDAIECLNEAENVLREAFDLLTGRRTNKLQSYILVELASTLGSKVRHLIDYTNLNHSDALELYREIRDLVLQARAIDPEGYYPIDVFTWTTNALIEADVLDVDVRAEAIADLLYIFSLTTLEDFGEQQERFETRRYEVGRLLNKEDFTDAAFDTLLTRGSGAGFYLRAFDIIRDVPFSKELTIEQRELSSQGADYLESHWEHIEHDGRCLYLLLRLWWAKQTGRPIFYGERQSLPFDQSQWTFLRKLLATLINTGELYLTPSLKYLTGLTAFQLGDIEYAIETFKELERESEYTQGRRRIIRSYLASNPDGSPKIFSGTVSWVNEERTKGELYVQELRRNIRFFPREFNRPNIQKYDALDSFYIAFNFIGPIAEPLSQGKSRHGRAS
jgi:hypothetical protein